VPDVMLISQVKWQEFSEKEKSILLEAAKDSLKFQQKLWAEQSEKELKIMESSGVKVFKVDDWVKEWLKNDIIDDKFQYGVGVKK